MRERGTEGAYKAGGEGSEYRSGPERWYDSRLTGQATLRGARPASGGSTQEAREGNRDSLPPDRPKGRRVRSATGAREGVSVGSGAREGVPERVEPRLYRAGLFSCARCPRRAAEHE
ncbi:hypothetical protein Kpho01_56070 [Kitasatospora phosalacinea]|uniref:Uncharacterized protein n=1 Tax=Kitasatospora phosalacinea TaxID=2065 RepID=A0A9W6UPK3_9ACTN|nr:hypothetical protein Kpho01_56070 [Kitasatospora phosalacinea]